MRNNDWRHTLFYSKLKELHPTIKSLTPYVSGLEPMKFRCTVCKHEYTNKPSYVIGQRKTGCPECKKKSVTSKSMITRSRQQEEKVKSLLSGSTTKLIGRMDNMRFFLQCSKCKGKWDAHINSIREYVNGGCKSCTTKTSGQAKSLESIEEIKSNRKDLKVLNYLGSSKVECECTECKHIWKTKIWILQNGSGCPVCGMRRSLSASLRQDKKITLQGKEFTVVGYEAFALEYLVEKGIRAKDISEKTIAIPYKLDGKNRKYIPDLFIKSTNTFIEVKSQYTLGLNGLMHGKDALKELRAKVRATKKSGYNITTLLVWQRHRKAKPIVIKLPDNWTDYPLSQVRKKFSVQLQNIISSKVDCVNVAAA